MTQRLFDVVFWLAAPFWALMILAPRWRWTQRIVASPLIYVPPLLVYLAVMAPRFAQFWSVMTRPNLSALQTLLAGSAGAAATWAHLVGFDLFLGRWMYLDALQRRIHPLIVSPILAATIVLSPIGVLTYLLIRSARVTATAAQPNAAPLTGHQHAEPPSPESPTDPGVFVTSDRTVTARAERSGVGRRR
jgi:hypothetical protein